MGFVVQNKYTHCRQDAIKYKVVGVESAKCTKRKQARKYI